MVPQYPSELRELSRTKVVSNTLKHRKVWRHTSSFINDIVSYHKSTTNHSSQSEKFLCGSTGAKLVSWLWFGDLYVLTRCVQIAKRGDIVLPI